MFPREGAATIREKLTELRVEKLKPRAGDRYQMMDTEVRAFGVVVFPSGQKTFIARFRTRGTRETSRVRTMRLGTFPEMSVADARDRAKREISARDGGNDPAAVAKAAKFAPSVSTVFPEYLDHLRVAEKLKDRTLTEYRRQWLKIIEGAIGKLKVTDVSIGEIASLHGKTLAEHPYLANRVLALLAAFFRWTERRRIRPLHSNPCTDIRPFREEQRERYLNAGELQRLGDALRAAETVGLKPAPKRAAANRKRVLELRAERIAKKRAKRKPYKMKDRKPTKANPFAIAAIRFLILTGWREQEALSLEWRALDLESQLANLRDTKTRQSFRTLSGAAIDLLRGLPRLANSKYVFPGRDSGKPITDIKHIWEAVRHAAELSDVRLHDLRHSFASYGASSLYNLPVLSKLLGHKDLASTQRYAHLADAAVARAADDIGGGIKAQLDGTTTPIVPIKVVNG